MGNDIAWAIDCDVTMSNDIAMSTMHYDVVMNLF